MTLRIEQSAEQMNSRRWRWSVWLTGEPEELDTVERVVYVLHSTFPDPVKHVDDRATGFRLDAHGWGEFEIRAIVRHMDGRETELRHELQLVADHAEKGGDEYRPPVVFVSYSSVDAPAVQAIRKALEGKVEVRDAGDVTSPGMIWEDQLRDAVKHSDALIAVTSGSTSKFVEREVEVAGSLGVPVIPIDLGSGGGAAGLSAIRAIEVDPGDVERSIPEIANSVFTAYEQGRPTR